MTEEDKDNKLLIYGMYSNFIKEIMHFDNMQTYFRILTSTVLLGSFAAIGFIFSVAKLTIPFERSFAASVIAVIGVTTLCTLWFVDLRFYERLLVSNFAEAYRLEKENQWLPKVHHNMLYAVHKKDHPTNIANYYIGGISILMITIGLAVFYDFYYIHNERIYGIGSFILSLIIVLIFYVMIRKRTKSIRELLKEAKYIDE